MKTEACFNGLLLFNSQKEKPYNKQEISILKKRKNLKSLIYNESKANS